MALGLSARDALADLVTGRVLECLSSGRDRYGRALAVCNAGETDIGAQLVADGWAVTDGRYRNEETAARDARKGIWQGTFIPPSQWRDGDRGETDQSNAFSDLLDGLFH